MIQSEHQQWLEKSSIRSTFLENQETVNQSSALKRRRGVSTVEELRESAMRFKPIAQVY